MRPALGGALTFDYARLPRQRLPSLIAAPAGRVIDFAGPKGGQTPLPADTPRGGQTPLPAVPVKCRENAVRCPREDTKGGSDPLTWQRAKGGQTP